MLPADAAPQKPAGFTATATPSFLLALTPPTHNVHRRWGSVFWRSWARVIRGRLPAIGRPAAGEG